MNDEMSSTIPTYKLWVNDERTVMVRMWASGDVEVAFREDPSHVWSPPVIVAEEPAQR